jgi:hypothetical protein
MKNYSKTIRKYSKICYIRKFTEIIISKYIIKEIYYSKMHRLKGILLLYRYIILLYKCTYKPFGLYSRETG